MVSLGVAAVLMLAVVIALAGIFMHRAGDTIVKDSIDTMEIQVRGHLVKTASYAADEFAKRLENLRGTAQLLSEIVMDRLSGYQLENWEDDRYVPFRDMDTGANIYPLDPEPLPLEWNLTFDITQENADELAQERKAYVGFVPFTTSSAAYFFQGMCDPSVVDTTDRTYLDGCTVENNNIDTGGIVHPTNESRALYEKASAIGTLMKPIYESQFEAVTIALYFKNEGAGTRVQFPGIPISGQAPPYISIGCDWMAEINPHTGRPLATQDEIKKCRPNGEEVAQRHYNAFERAFCREFVLSGARPSFYGPFVAVAGTISLFTVGSGVFDRLSGELIGCTAIDLAQRDIEAFLRDTIITDDGDVSLVWYDGRTVASTVHEVTLVQPEGEFIFETDFIDLATFSKLRDALEDALDPSGGWDYQNIRRQLEENVIISGSRLYTLNTLPPIPEAYDPEYFPEFLVIHSIAESVYKDVTSLEDDVSQEINRLLGISIAIGVGGTLVALGIVYGVSSMLTRPLSWMEMVAYSIAMPPDSDTKTFRTERVLQRAETPPSGALSCVPKTEIADLVAEFKRMIQGFSGSGPSRPAFPALREVENRIIWLTDFQKFYKGEVKDKRTYKDISLGTTTTEEDSSKTKVNGSLRTTSTDAPGIFPIPMKVNLGNNILKAPSGKKESDDLENVNAYRTSLCRWILILIVIPLVCANVAIFSIVTSQIGSQLPTWVDQAAALSLGLERDAILNAANRKAALAHFSLDAPVRDIHLYTRVAGWLLFGAIKRADTFTSVHETTEECKTFGTDLSCPFFQSDLATCPCSWNELNPAVECSADEQNYTRDIPERFFLSQARDFDPVTGARTESLSYPEFDDMPERTLWWNNTFELPGAEKGSSASGFETSYDRVRVLAPLATVEFPIFNYAVAAGIQKIVLGTIVAYEIDGLCTGYLGCDFNYAYYSSFQSDDLSLAYLIDPKLCPKGKYGFDPRCRSWYATGRRSYLEEGTPTYITPLYVFAGGRNVAATATSPIANPKTGEYVGQTLFDFSPKELQTLFDRVDQPISFVITPNSDEAGSNTVIRPNGTEVIESSSIGDLILPFDAVNSSNRRYFDEEILSLMQNGTSGIRDFDRLDDNGNTQRFTLAFSPVVERFLKIVDPSDYARGALVTRTLVYSVGVATAVESTRLPFDAIEDDVEDDLNRIALIYFLLIAVVTALFFLFMLFIVIEVTTPMILLLKMVQRINEGTMEEDLPPLKGGSAEIHQVYSAFAKLYKVVQISNTAFFSGNMSWSYHFMTDALDLFRRAEDEKAIGTICNNLGNTYFASSHPGMISSKRRVQSGSVCSSEEAISYLNTAVQIAEEHFDKCNENEKVTYAEQLSDRLFNRGIFYLSRAEQEGPLPQTYTLAYSDIAKAKELDYDVRNYLIEKRELFFRCEIYFARLLQRIRGLTEFWHEPQLRDIWNVRELIDDADKLLFASWEQPRAPLFRTLSPIGRLQQLESAAINVELREGNLVEAGRLAMRMFAEDEYILEDSFVSSAEAFLNLVNTDLTLPFSEKTKFAAKNDIKKVLRSCKSYSLDTGKCLVFALEVGEIWQGDPTFEKVIENMTQLYSERCNTYDYLGIVSSTLRGQLSTELVVKKDNEDVHKNMLRSIAEAEAEIVNPIFPSAVQLLIDSDATLDNDSFVLLITDGFSWDSQIYKQIKWNIERMNRERTSLIHVIIIGLDIDDKQVKQECQLMATVSKKSFYADVTVETADKVFHSVATTMTEGDASLRSLQSITMQKF